MGKLKHKIIKMLGGYTTAEVLKIEKEAHTKGYNEGIIEGRDEGYQTGCKDTKPRSYMKGWNEGYNKGHEDGYRVGYDECHDYLMNGKESLGDGA